MKKPASILAILLVIAIAVAGWFGCKNGDVTEQLETLQTKYDTTKTDADQAAKDAAAELETTKSNAAAELEAAKTAAADELTAAVDAAKADAAAELEAAKADAAAELEAAKATAAEELNAAVEAAKATAAEELNAAVEAAKAEAAAELEAAKADAEAKIAERDSTIEDLSAELEAAKDELEAIKNAPVEETAEEVVVETVEEVVAEPVEEVVAEPVEEVAAAASNEPVAEAVAEPDPDLAAAQSYLRIMYRNSPETTMTDYDVVGVINIGGIEFPVEWTADSDTIKFVVNDNKTVTVDVDEKNPEEVYYVLTGTLSNAAGETLSASFNHKVPAAMILEGLSYEEIVAAAYTLEDGIAMEEPQRLYGTVIAIPTPWSPDYKNITVDIQIGDLVDQPIQCYRLSGEGAENLQVGDKITVEGTLKNYKGTIEFDKGCVLVGYGEIVSQKAVLDAAYALSDGASMPNATALEGEIITIDTAWSEEYKNITVTIVCDGKTEQPVMCYRLSGEGADALAVGDKIAVYGNIKNYKGTIEFDKGCKLIPYGAAKDVRTVLSAYTLEDGLAMDKPVTLTGVIHKIPTAWSPDYKNITVDMTIAGMADYPIECYRLSGEGAEGLAIGDTITVTGTIKNYKGLIEFDKGCTLDAVVKAE